MIDVIEIGSISELKSYQSQWNNLLEDSETNVIFLTYEYCLSWWNTYQDNRELLVLIAKEDSNIVGIAPMVVTTCRRFGRKKRVVEFIGSLRSDYQDFIISKDKADVLEAFYQHLWSVRNRWDVIRLGQIPENSSTISCLQEHLRKLNLPFFIQQGSSCSIVQIEGHKEEVETKLRQQRTLRRYINHLERLGELKYGHTTNTHESFSYLDSFFQMHINRWEGTATLSTFYDERQRQFYCQLAQSLGPKGWLRFMYLTLNGMPIAFIFGFEYNRSLSLHRSAYELLYYNYSPGRIIIRYALQYCLANGLRDLDLLAGAEEYKGYVTNQIRNTKGIYIYKSYLQKWYHTFLYSIRHSAFISDLLDKGKTGKFRMLIRKYRSRYGTFELIKKILCRIISPVIDYSSNVIFEWREQEIPTLSAKCPLEIRVGSDADLNLIASFNGYTSDSAEIARIESRLQQGDKPYLAFSGLTLVNISWLCKRPRVAVTELWGTFAFGPDEAYINNCQTSFLFRGKNIYPVVLQRILKDLYNEGIKKVYIACKSSNKASIRGIQKAGFSPFKKLYAVKCLTRKIGKKTIQIK